MAAVHDMETLSPRIFAPSSVTINESQLCFNKNHFGRSDFDVQRFMNLARRRAGLKQIQHDLRLYLKCLQHSMIELINDDYADFVHLSSSLVGLQNSIEKIDKDIQNTWKEFEGSTRDTVITAERVEAHCEELSHNRVSQAVLRDKIAFLSAIQRLYSLLQGPPIPLNVLWLEKITSCVVDATSFKDMFDEESKERVIFNKILCQLETLLCDEGVRSANSDCSSLPLVLSLLSLANCSHTLTARLVADLIYPKLVYYSDDHYQLLQSVFYGVNEMRANWLSVLGSCFSGHLQIFLEKTLLTFILTFIDKCMGTVAVPSNTRLFHKCFTATQDFILQWPSHPVYRILLMSIRDKFNLTIYFKLETHRFSKMIDSEISPEVFELHMPSRTEDGLLCVVSSTIIRAIDTMWSDDVFLYPLIDKLWDFTLRILSKYLAWARVILQYIAGGKKEINSIPAWKALLRVRHDIHHVYSRVFDLALERIWTKLRDVGVDTSLFGQCLTRFGALVESECLAVDEHIVKIMIELLDREFSAIVEVPKQYRWTKKPVPSSHSPYISTAHSLINSFLTELRTVEHPVIQQITNNVLTTSYQHLVAKSEEVLDSVDATGSSLSRFKRMGAKQDGITDDDKIKTQIFRDLTFCISHASSVGVEIDGISALLRRSQPEETSRLSVSVASEDLL